MDDGEDEDLYEDINDLKDLDHFYIELSSLSEICSCIKVYDIGENTDNKALLNGQKTISLNMSVSGMPSAQEKNSLKCVT